MLEFVRKRASDRKLRLFACACCRRVWDHLWSGRIGHQAVSTAEEYADGLATTDELDACWRLVRSQLELYHGEPVYDASYWACGNDIREDVERCANYAANNSTLLVHQSGDEFDARCEKRREEELAVQASLLHDLFGPLLFRSITLDRSWFTSTVQQLAQSIYDDRAFDRLPILADALEDAGCDNADILNHCRQPGVHARGCWVVDLVLGKE
jgi:hypothetical protein